MNVGKRLAVLIEGESLLNDGTAVVLFQILLAGAMTGGLSLSEGFGRFVVVAFGGAVLGLVLGYAVSKVTERVDDPSIEITLTTILAYGSYLLAEQLHVSGVIATVGAGLMIGNYGAEYGMTARTRIALWSFWEYFAFVVNSLVFLLIGIEVHILNLLDSAQAILVALGTVLVARVLVVYLLSPVNNLFSARKIPLRWQHVLVWGGLHGGVSMALALSLTPEFPHRNLILEMTFGVVAFSIVVQGLTMKPLLRRLKLVGAKEHEYDLLKVRQAALSDARTELDRLLSANQITTPIHEQLKAELTAERDGVGLKLAELQQRDPELIAEELRVARLQLAAAEKSAIRRAAGEGLISNDIADSMIEAADQRLDDLKRAQGN
jgi:CPA1 family monovalent cation:H+ antiporter